MRRRRFRDRHNGGSSALIPYRDDERPSDRHQRRLHTNLDAHAQVEAWCRQREVSLGITNRGHHWQFRRDGVLVEWWPSSAKLAINNRWRDGVHVHDWEQLINELEKVFQ